MRIISIKPSIIADFHVSICIGTRGNRVWITFNKKQTRYKEHKINIGILNFSKGLNLIIIIKFNCLP